MTNLFAALTPDAREALIRDDVIELLAVIVSAVQDPERPDDRLAMKIAAEVYDEFAPGQPGIESELVRIREICASAENDFSDPVQDALLVALNRRRRELDELRAGKIGGHPVAYLSDPQIAAFLQPTILAATADVSLWALAWTVAMDDDGRMLMDCEHSIYAMEIDDEVRAKVHERMRRVNEVVGRMVGEFLGGE